jgi:beta-N-acetylhexosaminidase
MPSFFHHDFCRGVVEALDADADLLLLSYDSDQYCRAFTCALDGFRRGDLTHLGSVAPQPQRGEIAAPTAKSNEISARSHIADL